MLEKAYDYAAEAHAKLSIQRKEATAAEAEERKGLEIRKAEITYAQKLAEVLMRACDYAVISILVKNSLGSYIF